MKHTLILSLGTNSGDRFQNIESCINYINSEIGEVTNISSIYESPSWGFESDNFLNCALLVSTDKTALDILNIALQIELKMGRIRNELEGYQPRIIDIDIISYDADIINTPQLTVPHPLMQDRKFVLLPLIDLDPTWMHPILNKTALELLEDTKDTNTCFKKMKNEK